MSILTGLEPHGRKRRKLGSLQLYTVCVLGLVAIGRSVGCQRCVPSLTVSVTEAELTADRSPLEPSDEAPNRVVLRMDEEACDVAYYYLWRAENGEILEMPFETDFLCEGSIRRVRDRMLSVPIRTDPPGQLRVEEGDTFVLFPGDEKVLFEGQPDDSEERQKLVVRCAMSKAEYKRYIGEYYYTRK